MKKIDLFDQGVNAVIGVQISLSTEELRAIEDMSKNLAKSAMSSEFSEKAKDDIVRFLSKLTSAIPKESAMCALIGVPMLGSSTLKVTVPW